MKAVHQGMERRVLAIIGARGGSKRMKRKNMRKLGNQTLIQHTLDMAINSDYVDKVIFDSEDEEMLDHAYKNFAGISNKFEIHKRDKKLSGDDVDLYVPVKVVIEENPEYDIIIIMQPDCPVKNTEFIDWCIENFMEGENRCMEGGTKFPFEDVITVHNGMKTGSVRVISRDAFLSGFPTTKIMAVEDRDDFVDIHSEEDLKKANENLNINS